jgi:hypothetical protein
MKSQFLLPKLVEKLVWVPVISLYKGTLSPVYSTSHSSISHQSVELKIYVAGRQQWRRSGTKKERQDEISVFTAKIGGKTSLGPSYFVL